MFKNTDVVKEEVRELVEYLKGEDESEVTIFKKKPTKDIKNDFSIIVAIIKRIYYEHNSIYKKTYIYNQQG